MSWFRYKFLADPVISIIHIMHGEHKPAGQCPRKVCIVTEITVTIHHWMNETFKRVQPSKKRAFNHSMSNVILAWFKGSRNISVEWIPLWFSQPAQVSLRGIPHDKRTKECYSPRHMECCTNLSKLPLLPALTIKRELLSLHAYLSA